MLYPKLKPHKNPTSEVILRAFRATRIQNYKVITIIELRSEPYFERNDFAYCFRPWDNSTIQFCRNYISAVRFSFFDVKQHRFPNVRTSGRLYRRSSNPTGRRPPSVLFDETAVIRRAYSLDFARVTIKSVTRTPIGRRPGNVCYAFNTTRNFNTTSCPPLNSPTPPPLPTTPSFACIE